LSTLAAATLRAWGSRWPALSRTVGHRGRERVALALLDLRCVFTALAGPRLSLHTRPKALPQTLAQYTNTTKTSR